VCVGIAFVCLDGQDRIVRTVFDISFNLMLVNVDNGFHLHASGCAACSITAGSTNSHTSARDHSIGYAICVHNTCGQSESDTNDNLLHIKLRK
jgi:hypothetical protein